MAHSSVALTRSFRGKPPVPADFEELLRVELSRSLRLRRLAGICALPSSMVSAENAAFPANTSWVPDRPVAPPG